MHDIRTIGHREATFAIETITAEVAKRGGAAVVAVADAYGEIIAVLRMDHASIASFRIAQKKAFTSAREAKPSKEIGLLIRDTENGFDVAYFGDDRYIGWGGGIPVIVDGACVGAVAVSGLPEHEDIEICTAAVAQLVSEITKQ